MSSCLARNRSTRPAQRSSALGLVGPLIVATVSTVGCYSYRPLGTTAVPAKAEVRFEFTPAGADALRDAAGYTMRQLDGYVVQAFADSAVLVKPNSIVTVDGDVLPWRRGDLLVPWRTVAQSQQRTMDKRRSRGFAAVMGAVFTGVVYFALRSIAGGGGSTVQPGGGAPE
ncbi:hypothetical protein [Gemmatimonas sp.]|uniref:hypothetical protein n=1 Tax=Gemmatimonas sp. TaxID=1962908 RepID=UPI0025BFF503|nr:hypothetical protein [Gemmatimonas sp.]MCA2989412.1 hypothetical protein [Gemmatimonas sp.]